MTPARNDYGIDIVAERNGVRIAVQCNWNRRLESVDKNGPAKLPESLSIVNLGGGQTRLPVNSLLRKRKLHTLGSLTLANAC